MNSQEREKVLSKLVDSNSVEDVVQILSEICLEKSSEYEKANDEDRMHSWGVAGEELEEMLKELSGEEVKEEPSFVGKLFRAEDLFK